MFVNLFESSLGSDISYKHVLIILAASVVLGLVISLTYMLTHKKEGWAKSFPVTIIMLPAIIAIIILLVGNNVARAFSLAGAFSLIRFRSAPGDPKDIAYIFFTLAAGLACGMGYIGYGALFTVILCLIMIVIEYVSFGDNSKKSMRLKITVPEELNFEGAFDDILTKYTGSYFLSKIKTSDFGTLYILSYQVILKDGVKQKDFLDELRTRNANLNISLTLSNAVSTGE